MSIMNEINLSKIITGILLVFILLVALTGLSKINFSTEKYDKEPQEVHSLLLANNPLIDISAVQSNDSISNYILIDLRPYFEFEKGHLDNSIHIFAPKLLDKEPIKIFKKLQKDGKTAVLYCSNPNEATSSWYILTKMGFENIKILNAKTALVDDNFVASPNNTEILKYDIATYIKESNEIKKEEVKIEIPKPILKVVKPEKKVKVEVEEGGC